MTSLPTDRTKRADVCFLLEGTYPYVAGGVSTWVHELIKAQPDLTFHIVVILASRNDMEQRYDLPSNVLSVNHIFLQELDTNRARVTPGTTKLVARAKKALTGLLKNGDIDDLAAFLDVLNDRQASPATLMGSRPAWDMLTKMYEETVPHASFLDYFWTWRMLIGSLIATLSCELPDAGCYHTVSTGYAGLLAAKAHLTTGRPVILTEHGIYTNERRIEISMAEWLYNDPSRGLNLETNKRDLRDIWMDAFATFSRICYTAADEIITLYGGNQILQKRDGADPAKMRIVPNGVDFDGYSAIPLIPRNPSAATGEADRPAVPSRPPTIALIGRVVPIKDVKTFIRAVNLLHHKVPNIQAWIMGPYEEDMDYYEECKSMVDHMALEPAVKFLGRVNISEYLGRLDAIVLTSISEAQPLVILEAGAAGIPSVTTDVGACSEMIYGHPDETPALGDGGAVVPVANPAAIARELNRLLNDPDHWQACSRVIKERVRVAYHEDLVNGFYGDLYRRASAVPHGERLPAPSASLPNAEETV